MEMLIRAMSLVWLEARENVAFGISESVMKQETRAGCSLTARGDIIHIPPSVICPFFAHHPTS